MTRLFLIRHGETVWNLETRAQGSQNIELSATGRLQAKLLANRMSHEKIDCIYSSDLDRAYETATILGEKVSLKVNKIDGLREMCFGSWEGLTNKEIQNQYLEHYTIWRNKPQEATIPNGEKLIDVQKRALNSIYEIIHENKNKNIVMVSHGVTIKSILLGILDIELSNLYKIQQNNTAINIVDFKDYGPVIVCLNDTAHLKFSNGR